MFSSLVVGAKRGLAAGLLVAGAGLVLFPGPAYARIAYVTNSGVGSVSVLDLSRGAAIDSVPVGGEPLDVAITPDGKHAYVVDGTGGSVSAIDTATNAVVAGPVAVGEKPRGIAITPNGQFAYVTNSTDNTVSVLSLAANATVGAPVPVGVEPDGVAISPDGRFAFVAQRGGDISAIDTTTNEVIGSVTDGLAPSRIAIGPRGGRAFVTNSGSNSVTAFNPATRIVVAASIAVGAQPAGIAIEPKGVLAYAASPLDGTLAPINTSLNVPVGGPISFPGATGVAFAPDGLMGYVTDVGGASVSIFDTTRNLMAGSISTGSSPTQVAVVPNQGPVASFWVSPTRRRAKKRLTFHAGGSKDADGRITTYVWDFGDRRQAEGSAATRVHTYRKPGTYTVTLVVTDDECCSTEFVFTGQTASCNGSAAAAITIPIEVGATQGPGLRLAGRKRQRLRGRVKVRAGCPREACALRAHGVGVTVVENRAGLPRRHARRLGRAGARRLSRSWRLLRLRIPGRTRGALKRALRRGGEAKAKLTVIARDEDGEQTVRTRKVEFVLPRH